MHKLNFILFDLDGTLYSARYGLEQAVGLRVNEYIAAYLGLSLEDAWALRRERIARRGFGTTMEWLIAEHGLAGADIEDYLARIHPENEADALPPNPELGAFLDSIAQPKAILTNSPLEHAVRILDKLGIRRHFAFIFDIRFNGLKGKPDTAAFYRALDAAGTAAGRCLFVDDARAYVEGYRALGGTGVHYDELNKYPEFPGPRITALEELKNLL